MCACILLDAFLIVCNQSGQATSVDVFKRVFITRTNECTGCSRDGRYSFLFIPLLLSLFSLSLLRGDRCHSPSYITRSVMKHRDHFCQAQILSHSKWLIKDPMCCSDRSPTPFSALTLWTSNSKFPFTVLIGTSEHPPLLSDDSSTRDIWKDTRLKKENWCNLKPKHAWLL